MLFKLLIVYIVVIILHVIFVCLDLKWMKIVLAMKEMELNNLLRYKMIMKITMHLLKILEILFQINYKFIFLIYILIL